MTRFTTAVALTVAGLAIAACSDATRVAGPTRSASDAAAFSAGGNGNSEFRHEMPTIQAQRAQDAAKPSGGGSNTGILYHGGPVLQSGTKVAAIYWSSRTLYSGGPAAGSNGTGAQDGSLIGTFLSGLGGSPYFNINSTYTDGSGRGILNSVSYTQYYANNTNVPSAGQNVSDADMVAMLQAAFNSGKLTYDAGTLYHIFSDSKVNLGGGFGSQYCAYHTHGTVTVGSPAQAVTVLYSAMPYDIDYPANCTANLTTWPHNDAAADAEVNTLAHETEETTTDMMGTAWYDRRGYENADKCAWQWGTTYKAANGATANVSIGGSDWLVQMNWVNAGSGGCLNKY